VTDEIASAVGRRVQTRPLPVPPEAWLALGARRAQIEAWVEGQPPLRLVRVHGLLARHGVTVGYAALRRFASRELGWRKQVPTVRLEDPPAGQEAQIDFGLMGTVTDADGKQRRLAVLIVTLSASRYMYVWPTFTQTVDDVFAGLNAPGVSSAAPPKHIILDNAIVDGDPRKQDGCHAESSLRHYTDARKFFADTARAAVRLIEDVAALGAY